MNTNFHPSFVTPLSIFATRQRLSASKPKVPTVLLPLALCGLFLTVSPTRAQYVTPSSYMNDLYIWWKNAAPLHYDIQNITVRATFLGGTAHPTQGGGTPSMAIFEGFVTENAGGVGPLFGTLVARGTGTFCQADNMNSLSGKQNIPFWLYSAGNQLVLWMDLSSVWPNWSNAKNVHINFDKITSQGEWPWGNWTGLSSGVGSACGAVALACSVYAVPIH